MEFVEFIVKKIRNTDFDDGYIVQQILCDVNQLTPKTAKRYVTEFSPSKLGRLGCLGLRKLAIIKRDHPEIWNQWLQEYEQMKHGKQGVIADEDLQEAKEQDIAFQHLKKAVELVGINKVELWLQKFKQDS
ncbi:hypothetical protein DRP04_00200 [Archaeoglobales archaeon]|jgi:hypothetical protein|nr:MAG: hypothetical protein DRP04_00200 [Archaeoglobales archaeon]